MKMKRYGVRPINKSLAALAEGDSVSVVTVTGLLDEVRAINLGASGAINNFFKYIKDKFNIVTSNSNVRGFINTLKMLCAGYAGLLAGGHMANMFRSAQLLAKSAEFEKSLNVFQKILYNKKSINFFNHSMASFMIMSAMLSFAFYKLYKVIIKSLTSETGKIDESIENLYKELAIKKSIMESAVFFDKFNRITQHDLFTEADAKKSVNGIMAKAIKVCKEMFDGISNRGTALIKKYPNLISAMLICIGFVSVYHVNLRLILGI